MEQYLEKIAKEELNETPQRTENDLAALKEWISKQPHLIPRTDDKFLISFLRNTKYRLEAAKQKFDSYHTFRTNTPDWYSNRMPLKQNVYNLMKNGTVLPLLQPNPKDYARIIVHTLKKIAQNDCTMSEYVNVYLMTLDKYLITDDCATIRGQHSIIDFEGTTMITATQSLALVKKMIVVFEDVYPIRVVGFHLINLSKAPQLFEVAVKLFKQLCKTKLAERIYIHDNLESIYKVIPENILPTEYGGDAGSVESLMKNFIDEYNFDDEKWFLEEEKYKTDESKRIGGSKANYMFGTEGSFRKMEID